MTLQGAAFREIDRTPSDSEFCEEIGASRVENPLPGQRLRSGARLAGARRRDPNIFVAACLRKRVPGPDKAFD